MGKKNSHSIQQEPNAAEALHVCKYWKLEISKKHFEIKLHLIFNESVALSHACFKLANI